ncbi:MAG: phosphoglycerate dehydrogenase [Deltaproteobacteria bacterium]|nr:MAG: phosphoglycerate dehydrogenase [Deltaproteobacteria bacterium]
MICHITIPDDFPKVFSGTEAEDKARAFGDVKIYCNKAKTEEELIERIKYSQVVVNIRAYTYFTRRVLASCPNLQLISIWGTGTDNVDLESAAKLGITITNTPGANALSVAEHTIAILFSLARQIPFLDREIRSGNWPRVEMVQLSGKVMGLIGLGAIGKNVAKMARGLGMDVIAWSLHPSPERAKESGVRFVSKEELLKNADVVSLHLRLNDQTRGFFGEEEFGLMKPSAFFINTARAGLVEPRALYEALQLKKIAGAALDVYDQEPLPPEDPIIKLPNIVLTPHNAGMTSEATMNGLMIAIENVESFFTGNKINPANIVIRGSR